MLSLVSGQKVSVALHYLFVQETSALRNSSDFCLFFNKNEVLSLSLCLSINE